MTTLWSSTPVYEGAWVSALEYQSQCLLHYILFRYVWEWGSITPLAFLHSWVFSSSGTTLTRDILLTHAPSLVLVNRVPKELFGTWQTSRENLSLCFICNDSVIFMLLQFTSWLLVCLHCTILTPDNNKRGITWQRDYGGTINILGEQCWLDDLHFEVQIFAMNLLVDTRQWCCVLA